MNEIASLIAKAKTHKRNARRERLKARELMEQARAVAERYGIPFEIKEETGVADEHGRNKHTLHR
jgi:hypothetical protein